MCVGVGLKQDSKDFVSWDLDLSFCSLLGEALKRDRFKYGDIQRVFGAASDLPFHMAQPTSSYQKGEIQRSGYVVQRVGEKSRKNERR